MIERQSGVKNPFLAIALELARSGRTSGNAFTDETCRLAAADLGRFPSAPRPPRFIMLASVAALALGLWCVCNPFLSPRLLDYWKLPFSAVSRSAVAVSPGSTSVPLNAAVTLRLACTAARFPSCRLTLSSLDGKRMSSILLRPGPDNAFTCRLDRVSASFVYRFEVQGAAFGRDTVTVVPPPRLQRLSVAVTPPSYTRFPRRQLPEGQGDFDAYAGSRATIEFESDRLAGAWLICDRDTVAFFLKGKVASREIAVVAPCSYTIVLKDTLGQRIDSLPWFHIGCIPDEPPSVQIVRPGANRSLQPEQLETLAVEGVDDIGIRSMALKWRLSGDRRNDTGMRDLSQGSPAALLHAAFTWDLVPLSLFPGDTVYYWGEVTDTRPFGPPQRGVSDTFWFRYRGLRRSTVCSHRRRTTPKSRSARCGPGRTRSSTVSAMP